MDPSHLLRRAALVPVLGLLLVGGATGPAGAARDAAGGAVVSVQDFSFTASTVTVALGQSVTWQFHAMHTSTSDQGFWDSGMRSSGDYAVAFLDAGTFRYHCSMHPSMTGAVRVPLAAKGSAADGWRLRWSVRASTPPGRRYDVQYRRTGTHSWTSWRTSTAKRSGRFHPVGAGSYLVRARTHQAGVGTSSWSPKRTVTIG
ncbi:MAG TPA: hypothetical protein VF416_01620 [Marmoricola sp.]